MQRNDDRLFLEAKILEKEKSSRENTEREIEKCQDRVADVARMLDDFKNLTQPEMGNQKNQIRLL